MSLDSARHPLAPSEVDSAGDVVAMPILRLALGNPLRPRALSLCSGLDADASEHHSRTLAH